MKFSCVMTVYNEGEIIRRSIESVLGQSHDDLELIIVDDGSGAQTKAILAGLDDPRVIVLPQANDGLSSARNRGLRHCSGDYVCFLDADDIRAPWAFAEVARAIEKTGAELLLVRGTISYPRHRLEPFLDEICSQAVMAAVKEAETSKDDELASVSASVSGSQSTGNPNGEGMDLATRKAWASTFEPQVANKFISQKLMSRARVAFPNNHFFEDILFHTMAVAQARSIEFLDSRNFTYFQRLLRPQLTGSNTQSRFDIIGVAQVTLQLFRQHEDFHNGPQRSAVVMGALRLLEWCEVSIGHAHRPAYRAALGYALRGVDPLFFVFHPDTPDPRGEKARLKAYCQGLLGLARIEGLS